MELYPLKVFLTVATQKSFSRAAEKLLRTQPAVSLAIQKLESDLQEKLIDRSGKELLLTDAGRIVHDYARRFGWAAGGGSERVDIFVFAGAHRTLPEALSEGEGAGAAVVVEPDSVAT